MEINYHRTLGEEFGLNPAEYADIAIKELHFSVRVSNRLQRDSIHNIKILRLPTTSMDCKEKIIAALRKKDS